MDGGDRASQRGGHRLEDVMLGPEAVGRQSGERHVPAAIGEESADAVGGHGRPGVPAAHPAEAEQAVLPFEIPLELLETVGEPRRLDRHRVAVRRGPDLD